MSAGRAVSDAVAELGSAPSFVLAFLSGLHPAVAAQRFGDGSRGAPVVGMTGNGVIGGNGPAERGCSAIAFDESMTVGIGLARNATRNLRGAARSATLDALARVSGAPGQPLLVLLLDTRSGDRAEALAGVDEVAGPAVPIVGGAAAGGEPAQLIGMEATRECVVTVALVSPSPIGIGWAHGCRPREAPAIVTRSEGRLVREIDGRPAVDVYLERLGDGDLALSDKQFEALAVTHPLAQPELRGERHVRRVLGRRGDALLVATHIASNSAIEFAHETPEGIVAASRAAVGRALDGLDGQDPRAALLFDGAGRKCAGAGSPRHEVSAPLDVFPSPRPPLAGLFTHGEIARTRGARGDLDHAFVAVAFA
jgi:hypothetical protein